MTNEPLKVFPELIHRAHYKWDKDRVLPALKKCVENRPIDLDLEVGPAATSASNSTDRPHNMPEFQDFYQWLGPVVRKIMFEQWNIMPRTQFQIGQSWTNYHDRGGQTLAHTHGTVIAAISAYIQVPEHSGGIEFYDPNTAYWRFHPQTGPQGGPNRGWHTLPVSEGDVLIFPGWLEHRTQVHQGREGELRWVLTTNVSVRPSN